MSPNLICPNIQEVLFSYQRPLSPKICFYTEQLISDALAIVNNHAAEIKEMVFQEDDGALYQALLSSISMKSHSGHSSKASIDNKTMKMTKS